MRISTLVRLVRKRPERHNRPTNLTLDPEVKRQAVKLASSLGYSSLSEWVCKLLNEEIQRVSVEKSQTASDDKAVRQLLEKRHQVHEGKAGGPRR